MDQSFHFGSPAGSALAFWFFGLIALFVGVAVYLLSTNSNYRRARFRSVRVLRPWQGLLLSSGLGLFVFGVVYLTALDGFYGLTVHEGGIRLHYILPERTLWLRSDEIAEVRTAPSYKSRWRVHIYTPSGEEFASAHANYPETRKAGEYLAAYVAEHWEKGTELQSRP